MKYWDEDYKARELNALKNKIAVAINESISNLIKNSNGTLHIDKLVINVNCPSQHWSRK